MANIFKKRILEQRLENYSVADLQDKIKIIERWLKAYKDGSLQKKTETQCEQSFNQDFFVQILGYKMFPEEEYSIDPKAATDTTGQKPDAALGYFTKNIKRVLCVVEIKDANTALDRSQQRHGNLSPVQQAFKYKPQYENCNFVIATNFFETRLYRDNQISYESFTLETLLNPKNNYSELKKFYYLLNVDNFVSAKGASNTEELVSEIQIQQEKITKEFYEYYKELRLQLMRNIYANNAHAKKDPDFLINKSQKILDRTVFCCFCEDIGLLPEHTIAKLLSYSENSYSSLWHNLKGFFNAIDKGSTKLQIPQGYNGGLFAQDPDLQALAVDDDVCKQVLGINKYDFSEDLTVNILGHIFEQSITDLEEIKEAVSNSASGEKLDLKALEKMESKRKSAGIYYTPEHIVDYIVRGSLGRYLQQKEDQLKEKYRLKADITDKNYRKREISAYQEYQQVLHDIKVLDPACGSGAFLVKVFDYLLAENRRTGEILGNSLFHTDQYYRSILHNNIYGVDITAESVEITKLSLWLKTAQQGKKLEDLDDNILCGNSLIDDPSIDPKRAFQWDQALPDIMSTGGFDVIVGNPPWGATFDEQHLTEIKVKNRDIIVRMTDSYMFFINRVLGLMKDDGYVGLIVPDVLLYQTDNSKLRKKILKGHSLVELVNLGDAIFEGVARPSCVIIFTGQQIPHCIVADISGRKITDLVELEGTAISQSDFHNFPNSLFPTKYVEGYKILDKIKGVPLKDVLDKDGIQRGVSPDLKEAFIVDDQVVAREKLEKNYVKPTVTGGRQLGKYVIKADHLRVLYINSDVSPDKIPNIVKFVSKFETKITCKEAAQGKHPLYALHRARDEDIFTKTSKLIGVITGDTIIATLDKAGLYPTDGLYLMSANADYDNRFVLAVLNSRLFSYLYRLYSLEEGRTLAQIKPKILEQLPFIKVAKSDQEAIIKIVDDLLRLNSKLRERKSNMFTILQSEFPEFTVTEKVHTFWQLSFTEFVKSSKLKKLSLKKKEELVAIFDEYKDELSQLHQQCVQHEQSIDDSVFKLYGLTDDQIAMVCE